MQSFIPQIQQVFVIYQVPAMMADTGDSIVSLSQSLHIKMVHWPSHELRCNLWKFIDP